MVNALIVDDDPHDRGLLVMAAGEVIDKQNIIEASSAEAAINLINSVDFDVVVIDVRLSQSMNLLEGFDVVRLAKKKYKNTQVIVVTSYPTQGLEEEAIDCGAYVFIDRTDPDIKIPIQLPKKIREALNSVAS